jgi:hypothetical protein
LQGQGRCVAGRLAWPACNLVHGPSHVRNGAGHQDWAALVAESRSWDMEGKFHVRPRVVAVVAIVTSLTLELVKEPELLVKGPDLPFSVRSLSMMIL